MKIAKWAVAIGMISLALSAIAGVAGSASRIPTLGYPSINPDCRSSQCGLGMAGWGTIRPKSIYMGGDPTGLVQNITWSSWGGATAKGQGLSWYVSPNEFVSQGHHARAVVVAFKPGVCDGHYVYSAVEWYFPQYGERFNPKIYNFWCNGLGSVYYNQKVSPSKKL